MGTCLVKAAGDSRPKQNHNKPIQSKRNPDAILETNKATPAAKSFAEPKSLCKYVVEGKSSTWK